MWRWKYSSLEPFSCSKLSLAEKIANLFLQCRYFIYSEYGIHTERNIENKWLGGKGGRRRRGFEGGGIVNVPFFTCVKLAVLCKDLTTGTNPPPRLLAHIRHASIFNRLK